MDPATITLWVLAALVVLFVWNRLPVELVAFSSALTLYGFGVLELPQMLAGFADPTVVLIASLFVVSEGIDATGVTTWAGDRVLERAGGDQRRVLLLVMLLGALVTSLIAINGAVAALLPLAVVVATRSGVLPSRLLLPMVFAGGAGSLLFLTGAPVNVAISEASAQAGAGRIAFAEFALIGVPLLVGTVLVVLLLGDRLIPERTTAGVSRDLSNHAATLIEQYALSNVVRATVGPDSGLVGRPREGIDLSPYRDLRLVTLAEAESGRPVSEGPVAAGDRLTLVGDPDEIEHLVSGHRLVEVEHRSLDELASDLLHREGGVAEVVIPPRSRFVGELVAPGQVVQSYGLVVLAVQRQGRDLGTQATRLQPGDAVLVEGPWPALDALSYDLDLLLVDSPGLVRRRAVPLSARSGRAIVILGLMVVLLATGLVPPVVATMLAAGAIMLTRVLTVQQAYRGVNWTTVLLVAGMLPLSTAITQSGAGDLIAGRIIGLVGEAGPVALLVALFLLTAVLSQLIANIATALVVIPIAVTAAEQFGVSARPVLMTVCVASAAAFLTPVATPPNMMVMGPGGYRFGDYARLGLPLLLLYLLVSIGLIPLIWPF